MEELITVEQLIIRTIYRMLYTLELFFTYVKKLSSKSSKLHTFPSNK